MQQFEIREESHGCTEVPGFCASGVHCDVRGRADGRLDLALVVSESPSTVAGVFTRNKMAAAPVRLCRELISSGGNLKGFVVNSGNANACTGTQGMKDALEMQRIVSAKLRCRPEEVLVASTGRIGERLPMQRIAEGIDQAFSSLKDDFQSGLNAADAILTSDTSRKVCTAIVHADGGDVTISGMAKGAGMIEPNMATMLAFICTDAALSAEDADVLLRDSVNESFNAITVDGDESTNDSVLLLANGASGIRLEKDSRDYNGFKAALNKVCGILARKIVGDGEKITKVVEVCIEGAATLDDAQSAARAIGNSLLVKSSWYGNDPNWGRVMDAVGYSGADTSEESIRMWYGRDRQELVEVFECGRVHDENKSEWKQIVSGDTFKIVVDLGIGDASYRIYSTDLTEEYVNFNKSE